MARVSYDIDVLAVLLLPRYLPLRSDDLSKVWGDLFNFLENSMLFVELNLSYRSTRW